MNLKISVFAQSVPAEKKWQAELRRALGDGFDVECGAVGGVAAPGELVLIDADAYDPDGLDALLARLDRRGRAVVLIVPDGAPVPVAWAEGKVDDILVSPLRALEVASKIQQIQQVLMWDEVSQLNASFSTALGHLKQDLHIAERLQKSRLPARFPELKGISIHHRYLAGGKSGGDHFDIGDSRDGRFLSLVLSDASSYGLSSAILGVLLKVAVKLSGDEARSAADTVRRIRDELLLTLNERDRLSLFYGVVSRADWKLRYLNLGESRAFYSGAGGRSFVELPAQGLAIARAAAQSEGSSALALQAAPAYLEQEFQLEPQGRLVLLSDGFIEAAGGPRGARALLETYRRGDPKDCLNEMAFKVKSAFEGEDDLPPQDCTAVILDIESNVVRLTR